MDGSTRGLVFSSGRFPGEGNSKPLHRQVSCGHSIWLVALMGVKHSNYCRFRYPWARRAITRLETCRLVGATLDEIGLQTSDYRSWIHDRSDQCSTGGGANRREKSFPPHTPTQFAFAIPCWRWGILFEESALYLGWTGHKLRPTQPRIFTWRSLPVLLPPRLTATEFTWNISEKYLVEKI